MKRKVSGGKHLNKEESLAFLQNCIEKEKEQQHRIFNSIKKFMTENMLIKRNVLRTKEIKNERNYMCIN
jgi:polyhydroxyalkanoate synthesis regulator phasin